MFQDNCFMCKRFYVLIKVDLRISACHLLRFCRFCNCGSCAIFCMKKVFLFTNSMSNWYWIFLVMPFLQKKLITIFYSAFILFYSYTKNSNKRIFCETDWSRCHKISQNSFFIMCEIKWRIHICKKIKFGVFVL